MKMFVLLILAMFLNCEAQSKLPKDLPSNAEIIYISEGGMVPSLFRVEIIGNKMKITENSVETGRKNVVREESLSETEVKSLYQVFVENKFDSIKPNEDIGVADGKSRSIELKFDQKRFYAINGDGYAPPKGHAERFSKIEDAIGKLISAHPENNSSKYADKIAVIAFDSTYQGRIFGIEGNPTSLSETEIGEINKIVEQSFSEYNAKHNVKVKFNNYKFQYFAALDAKNQKIIAVNAFCNANENWTKTDWRKQLILVKDGGSCYGRLTVNLTKKTSSAFFPNGEA